MNSGVSWLLHLGEDVQEGGGEGEEISREWLLPSRWPAEGNGGGGIENGERDRK